MSWPARPWICLDCRMTSTTDVCPGGHRRLARFHDADGREALVAEVWGPPRLRQRALEATRAGAGGGAAWSVLDGCANATFDLDAFVVVMLVVGLVVLVGRFVGDAWRRRQHRRLARGATRKLLAMPRTGQVGTIRPRATADVPGLGEGAVAFAAEYDLLGRRMLHDAATLGFEIDLDSGERVLVPAGACRIDVDQARSCHADTSAHLAALDFARPVHHDPFVHGSVRAVLLRPGDRVEVCSELDPLPDAAGYRELGNLRAPRGVIRLRPC